MFLLDKALCAMCTTCMASELVPLVAFGEDNMPTAIRGADDVALVLAAGGKVRWRAGHDWVELLGSTVVDGTILCTYHAGRLMSRHPAGDNGYQSGVRPYLRGLRSTR